jgi:hypothetical protein
MLGEPKHQYQEAQQRRHTLSTGQGASRMML